MKRTLIAALLALLLLCPCLAAGETANYAATQAFIDALSERDIACRLHGLDSTGTETVTVQVADGNTGVRYTVRLTFDASGDVVILTVPEVITYGEMHRDAVIRACNTLNSSFMYTRFIADEARSAVDVSLTLLLGGQDTGDVMLEAFDRLVSILSEAYFTLAVYGG
ncbi:MAG: hypothetical protein ACI4MG_11470 [Aristaeellaceae bacterium]